MAISGVAEIAGGLAVLHPATRRFGRWWLLALLVAVFPANVHMAVNPEQIQGLDLNKIPRWALWARLPLQPLAMLWVWRATRAERGLATLRAPPSIGSRSVFAQLPRPLSWRAVERSSTGQRNQV